MLLSQDLSIELLIVNGLVVILVIALVFTFVYFIYYVFFQKFFHKQFFHKDPKIIKEGFELLYYTPFFKALDVKGKEQLVNNANKLLINTSFVTDTGQKLEKSQSFKIALVLAMVALGLEKGTHYDALIRVVVYKDVFFSKRADAYVRGLSTSNVLFLSWKDFEYGFLHMHDRYNVGIHEAAHLLTLCGYVRIGVTRDAWTVLANQFINDKNHNNGSQGIFRAYAFANLNEFWACCVEQFYETPAEFSTAHSQLYDATKNKLGFSQKKEATLRYGSLLPKL